MEKKTRIQKKTVGGGGQIPEEKVDRPKEIRRLKDERQAGPTTGAKPTMEGGTGEEAKREGKENCGGRTVEFGGGGEEKKFRNQRT